MNILIVDDNKNNRMILKLLLEDYMDENPDVSFDIGEAEDGNVAVEKCKMINYDIVLMDIMMPNMDGIEATKIIRAAHPKIMIIAVSAVDDTERKKLILNYGAEDYIPKPVNADIFISRITNYLTICESRKTSKVESSLVANLFTKNVFSRHTRFLITSEDSLSEFWEFYLLSDDIKPENFSDTVRTVFALAEINRKYKANSDIFVEESQDKMYFTLSSSNVLPQKIIDVTMQKNNFQGNYKVDKSKVSFEIDNILPDLAVVENGVDKSEIPVEIAVQEQEVPKEINIQTSKELKVFDYMDKDDLIDTEEYIGALSSMLLIVGGGGVTQEETAEICQYLHKIGYILSTYNDIHSMAQAIIQLSEDIGSHTQEFIDNSEALGPMCKAFSNDLSSWFSKSFQTGAPSIDFMNDTIEVNCQTIAGMLKMNDEPAENESFDDIFDF